jgi:type I site-specific restriction endonuclease
MSRNEADTRAELIDPALHACGWTAKHVKRQQTAGAITGINGQPQRTGRRTDCVLRFYAEAGRRQHVPFVYSSNGDHLVECDRLTGLREQRGHCWRNRR